MKQRLRNRFRGLTVLQILLLVAMIAVLAYTVLTSDFVATPIVVGIIVILQIFALIAYVEKHVDSLEEFFAAINYEDLTRRFVEDDVDGELKLAFNRVLEKFQDARAQRDIQANYLETVVQHVPVPFVAARADGSLSLANNPARRLTGLPALRHIDDLAELDASLPETIKAIEPGQQQLLQTRLRNIPAELRVSVSEIRMGGEVERLYCIENLSGELTAREASAWRNLIRVLTHEIMNTLTPVTSLAETTRSMLDEPDAINDIREAVTTIARRSEGLMQFVSKYRELLHVPTPVPESVSLAQAFNSVTTLMREQLEGVDLSTHVNPESLEVFADPNLLDQILLNLVKNASDAMAGRPSPALELLARLDFGHVLVQVRDNGPGIRHDDLDQVFVPFFTTKKEGSGIGLSLSRQIMTAHNGEIALESGATGTTVNLVF